MTKPTNPFSELERLFERLQQNFEQAADRWETTSTEGGFVETRQVNVDLEDQGAELVLTADLPGFDTEDIDVRVTDQRLRLEAEHEEEATEEAEGEYIRRERRSAAVARTIPLPDSVETDDISATHTNGVLTVHMPKREPTAEGKEIEIN